ncbi:hypothetical protein GDO86_017693 [Hymenochirus boettgeri]|uniref:NIF3-like protein 1 n=2 Tax=Hymenochirus TaxID=8361 RepID=A0A8T2IST0_9PIPI|nr:hypothetical protein GDO86_017693 [Hymenochirus boettgeri]
MSIGQPFRFLLPFYTFNQHHPRRRIMELGLVVSRLNVLTPPALAESWDNVGLLVEPSPPHLVQKIILTNDLTEDVLEEAVECGANVIVSYHPPIFKALKHLTCASWKERLMIRAIEKRLAVYSPHTSCDALANGVNDWLAKALGSSKCIPIHHSTSLKYPGTYGHLLEFIPDPSGNILSRVKNLQDVSVRTSNVTHDGESKTRVSLSCSQNALVKALGILTEEPSVYSSVEVLNLQKPPLSDTGMGRLCTLPEPISIAAALERIKNHLHLPHLRLALGRGRTIESPVSVAAVCAGSGSSILRGVPADLYLTGEMSHHDVLDAVAEGCSVVLCEHSNSERGYLHELGRQIQVALDGQVDVVVSVRDKDPLQVV